MDYLSTEVRNEFDKKMIETAVSFFVTFLGKLNCPGLRHIEGSGESIFLAIYTDGHRREARISFKDPLDPVLIVEYPTVVHLRDTFGNISPDELIALIERSAH